MVSVLILLLFSSSMAFGLTNSDQDLSGFLLKLASVDKHGPLVKNTTHTQIRLMFVAGLEGSGHHALRDMMGVCSNQAFCQQEEELSVLSCGYSNEHAKTLGLFGGENGHNNHEHLRRMLHRMRNMVSNSDLFTRVLYYMGLSDLRAANGMYPGMLSYPNGPSPHKTLDRPDMFVLAALAETASLDIRFLVILRSAEAALHSTMDNRHFGSMEPQILVSNAEAMYAQMQQLSSVFYKCVNYEDLVYTGLNTAQKHTLIDFLHPAVISHNSSLLDAMLHEVEKHGSALSLDGGGGNGGNKALHHHHHHSNTSDDSNNSSSSIRYLVKKLDFTNNERINRAYHVIQLQTRINMIIHLCSTQQAWL